MTPTFSLVSIVLRRKVLETYNRDDFDRTKPELKFTEELNTEVIDTDNGDQEDCNPDSGIDFIS